MQLWTTLATALSIVSSAFALAPHATEQEAPPEERLRFSVHNATFTLSRDAVDVTPAAHVRAYRVADQGEMLPVDVTSWTIVLAPVPAAGAALPAPAPAPRDDAPRPQPAPAWAAPRDPLATPRSLGMLRALRDIVLALLEILRAAGFLAALLYHRVTRADALDHPLRARLLDALAERPGAHVAALAEAVDAHPKTVAYHLRVLARLGSVRLAREGRVLRAWPSAAARGAPPESGTRARVLELLRDGAAADRDALAQLLGVTPQAMSYHLKILRHDGRVRVRWLGRRREYEAA